MCENLEKCTSGQVKRIMTIMSDTIPTNLSRALINDVIKHKLRDALVAFWRNEDELFCLNLLNHFNPALVLEVNLSDTFSFADFVDNETSKNFISSKWKFRMSLYPKIVLSGKKQAIIVQTTDAIDIETFISYVALHKGYLPGREGLIQTHQQNTDKIYDLLKLKDWLIAPIHERDLHSYQSGIGGVYPALHKSQNNFQDFEFTIPPKGNYFDQGTYLLFFID